MNYDDAKIRQMLLRALPDLNAPMLEMEEYDYGDRLGVSYVMDGTRVRFSVLTVGKSEERIARELLEIARVNLDLKRKRGRPNLMESKLLHGA